MMVLPESLFASAPAAALLRDEMHLARECALRQPGGRALLLAPCTGAGKDLDWDLPHLPAVRVHVSGFGLDGDVRCAAQALPWEDAAFQMIGVQHAGDVLPDAAALIAELARVLAPGGTLIWFGFNTRSPWFAWCRWRSKRDRVASADSLSRRHAAASPGMHRHLFDQRLQTDGFGYLGPCWPTPDRSASAARRWRALDTLRAACFLVARNRPQVLTPLRPRGARRTMASHPQLAGTPSQRARA